MRRSIAGLLLLIAHRAARLDCCGVALWTAQRAASADESWSEPLLWCANWRLIVGEPSRALEDLIGANSRAQRDRRVMLSLAMALDRLGICGEAYEWHCKAAHAAGDAHAPPTDSESDALFWLELGRYCLRHERTEEALEVAALSVLTAGFTAGRPVA